VTVIAVLLVVFDIDPAIGGLLLSYSMQFYNIQFFGAYSLFPSCLISRHLLSIHLRCFLVRTIVDAEGELTSAERLSYFYRGVPQESNSGAPLPSESFLLTAS